MNFSLQGGAITTDTFKRVYVQCTLLLYVVLQKPLDKNTHVFPVLHPLDSTKNLQKL